MNFFKQVKRIFKFLGSPKMISSLELAVAVVALFQAIETFKSTHRTIGFK